LEVTAGSVFGRGAVPCVRERARESGAFAHQRRRPRGVTIPESLLLRADEVIQ